MPLLSRHRRQRGPAWLVAGLAVLALAGGACGDQEVQQRQAEAPDDGVQLTGRVGGAQLSVSYGDPDFQVTDCDPDDGVDFDWCLRSRSIDGADVVLVVENPALLTPGEKFDVGFDRCVRCDDVTDHAVVDLRLAGTSRRAVDGTVTVTEAGPRYVFAFTLRFDDGGTINGQANVRPLGLIVPPSGTSDEGATESDPTGEASPSEAG